MDQTSKSALVSWWPPRWLHLRRLEQHELTWLAVGFCASVFLLLFIAIASQVVAGDTQTLDVRILLALRNPADPARPIGPWWLQLSGVDITSLGSFAVLTLVSAAVVGFLVLQGRPHTAVFVALTAASGEAANYLLKQFFNRPRPTVVPHLVIASPSFPSGHAMESAIVYLTLGAVMMRVAERRVTKMYCLGIAVLLTVLVGLSRIYLGVHYPSDVVAGWAVGFMWASAWWLVAQHYERRTIERERDKTS